ncbi:MAG: hypothetical protein ACRDOF_07640 [Gaiellaceae bacterium]
MRLVGLAVAALALVSPAAAATPVKAKLTTTTPTPVVDQPWRYTVTIKSGAGAPLRARTRLQLLLGETVVACWQDGEMKQFLPQSVCAWIAFKGKRTGILRFPAESVGVRLTFQAVVKSQGQTRRLRAPVTVRTA